MKQTRIVSYIRTSLHIVSFGLLIYILVESFFHIDIAATKNDALTQSKKIQVDKIQSIDSVKTHAKHYLDQIRIVQTFESHTSLRVFRATIALLLIQTILLLTKQRAENNGR